MSSDALPITPVAFAAALEALPLSTLHLKAAELRNSLAHLEYSNAQLEPFAHPPAGEEPDPVCTEAIEENVVVMGHMRERLELLKDEAEKRGVGWGEFVGQNSATELDEDGPTRESTAVGLDNSERGLTTEENEDLRILQTANRRRSRRGSTESVGEQPGGGYSAWTDGTFQTGRITNGIVTMDSDINSVQEARQTSGNNTTGPITNGAHGADTTREGRLSDEELRRRLEERLTTEEDGSMHL